MQISPLLCQSFGLLQYYMLATTPIQMTCQGRGYSDEGLLVNRVSGRNHEFVPEIESSCWKYVLRGAEGMAC